MITFTLAVLAIAAILFVSHLFGQMNQAIAQNDFIEEHF